MFLYLGILTHAEETENEVELFIARSFKINKASEKTPDENPSSYLIIDHPEGIIRISDCYGTKGSNISIFMQEKINNTYNKEQEKTVARWKQFKTKDACSGFQEALLGINSTTRVVFGKHQLIVGTKSFALKDALSRQAREIIGKLKPGNARAVTIR